jgi:hypothetical protein
MLERFLGGCILPGRNIVAIANDVLVGEDIDPNFSFKTDAGSRFGIAPMSAGKHFGFEFTIRIVGLVPLFGLARIV